MSTLRNRFQGETDKPSSDSEPDHISDVSDVSEPSDGEIMSDEETDAKTPKECCSKGCLLLVMFILGLIVIIAYFGKGEIEGLDEFAESEENDHYQMLGLPRTCTQAEIKAQYKTLVLQWHPDKCKESVCEAMYVQYSKAYEVLSDPTARKLYDASSRTYATIESSTIALNNQNFDELVLQSDYFWFIEVYADWSDGSIAFATRWEEEASKLQHNKNIRFGRIHASWDGPLLRRMSIFSNFRLLPTVFSYYGGRLQSWNRFTGPRSKFSSWISSEMPNLVDHLSPSEIEDLTDNSGPTFYLLTNANKPVSVFCMNRLSLL